MNRPLLFRVSLALLAFAALTWSALGTATAGAPGKSHCKKKGHATLCGKPKKTPKVLFAYGSYGGRDGFGPIGAEVRKASSGTFAGKTFVSVETAAYKVAVTCADGSEEQIHPYAAGVVHGKSFSGSYAGDTYSYSISGSFTSLKTMKGVYTFTAKSVGYNIPCTTGEQPFTATWSP